MNSPGGLILLNKPPGITSFRGLNVLKKTLKTGKVGHTGTLDKFAEGLIVALYGKMTKLVPEFTGMDKTYVAKIFFGSETDTLDPEGEVVYYSDPPELKDIEKAVPSFVGAVEQIPPQYSAIHINGKRAYEMVRAGEDVQIPSREVVIYSFDIISYEKPFLTAEIHCSKGTYIRSLARDLAQKCGSRAHLAALQRTSVGPFRLEESVDPESFNPDIHTKSPWEIFDYIDNVEKLIVDECFTEDIKVGKESVFKVFDNHFLDMKEYALFNSKREMLALTKKNNGKISYRFVC